MIIAVFEKLPYSTRPCFHRALPSPTRNSELIFKTLASLNERRGFLIFIFCLFPRKRSPRTFQKNSSRIRRSSLRRAIRIRSERKKLFERGVEIIIHSLVYCQGQFYDFFFCFFPGPHDNCSAVPRLSHVKLRFHVV